MYIPIGFRNNGKSLATSRTVLAGDIGATKTNLALVEFTGEKFSIIKEDHYHTKDIKTATAMISGFLEGQKMPGNISFGVAGPVRDNKVNITNVSWEIDGHEIAAQYNNNIPVCLINDLEATAYGLAGLEEKDIHSLYEPAKRSEGNIALIAPGTGLGEAGLYWNGTAYYPFANEGGHCDFAPRTELDAELYFYLHKKFGHVSWERVVSGQGIVTIYEFLRIQKDRDVPAWLAEKMLVHDKAAVISENAEEAAICGETMDLFFRYLATESANLALKFKSTGGVYIGGGIMPKILRLVKPDMFMRWFRDFGRLRSLLSDMPVKIVLNDKTALLGAAYYGAFAS